MVDNWAIELVNVTELVEWDKNPMTHTASGIKKLAINMCRHGFTSVLTYHKPTNTLLAGHKRRAAFTLLLEHAKKFGLPGNESAEWDDAPEWFQDMAAETAVLLAQGKVPARAYEGPLEQAHELALFDNYTARESNWDRALLAPVIHDLPMASRAFIGFNGTEIDALLESYSPVPLPDIPLTNKPAPKKDKAPKEDKPKPLKIKVGAHNINVFNNALDAARDHLVQPTLTADQFVVWLCTEYLKDEQAGDIADGLPTVTSDYINSDLGEDF